MSQTEAGFCPACDVTLDLHSVKDGTDPVDCEVAQRKADLLADLDRAFGLVP